MKTLNCNDKILDLTTPVVMGIINLTPDSFYKDSRKGDAYDALSIGEKMLTDGAQILDLGAVSSRPFADRVDEKEELKRIYNIAQSLRKEFPKTILSLDTVRHEVMNIAIDELGIDLINDISAGIFDNAPLVQKMVDNQIGYVAMHMQGDPSNMQDAPVYQNVNLEILEFFKNISAKAQKAGLINLIIDPGFGFGKTIDHNYSLLKHLSAFKILEHPVLAGLSRKSMIYKYLKTTADEALNGTSVLHLMALQNSVSILRVHDVLPVVEVIKLWNKSNNVI